MIDAIGSIIGSAAGGGILGVAGALIKGIFETRADRLARDHDLDLARIRADADARAREGQYRVEAATRAQVAADEARTAEAQANTAEAEVRKAAITAEAQTTSPDFAGQVKALIRPFLTIYLVGLLTYVYTDVATAELQRALIDELVFLTSTAVTFWFGDRRKSRRRP